MIEQLAQRHRTAKEQGFELKPADSQVHVLITQVSASL